VMQDGKPLLALGVPGSTLIPTAMFQVLLDRLAFGRPLEEAIGDTRVHFMIPWRAGQTETLEAEQSLPAGVATAMQARGWRNNLREPAGRGRRFGGVNAVEISGDGTLRGYADPRRTNTAAGY
jgi:gamma-glutamyltranspeptidase / glutathione hydrolase